MSNTFSAVENQIKIFKEMQDEIAKDTGILSYEERRELEGYVDNQRRQCELDLKLKPKKKEAEPAPAAKPEKKSSRGRKAEAKVTAPAADKTEEEKLDQNLFDEEPEKQATEIDIDIDDLLG